MATVNTAISIQTALYQQAIGVAAELQISQEELFTRAIAEYVNRHQGQKLLQDLNAAYADGLDPDEQTLLEGMRRHQQRLIQEAD